MGVTISNCGSISIHKTGYGGAALAGAGFTLYPDVAPFGGSRGAGDTPATTKVCTTDAAGDCSITSVPMGTYWIVESTVPAGYAAAADVAVSVTSNAAPVAVTIADPPLAGTITLHKQNDDQPASGVAGAVFTLYADGAPVGGTAPGAEDTTALGTCESNASGDCSFTSVPLGEYWVVETTTPAGHDGAGPQHATIGLGTTSAGDTEALTFTNQRRFTVIVLVCQESTGRLYPSAVTVDAAGTTSLSHADAVGAGLNETTLCGLGGARYTGKHHGNHPAGVNIPQ